MLDTATLSWVLLPDPGQPGPKLSTPAQPPQMDSSLPEGTKFQRCQQEEPAVVQIDPKWCAILKAMLLWKSGNTDIPTYQPPFRPQGVF